MTRLLIDSCEVVVTVDDGGTEIASGSILLEDGTIASAETLRAWLHDILRHGSGRADAILLSAAYLAARDGDAAGLEAIAELGHALQPTRELLLGQ